MVDTSKPFDYNKNTRGDNIASPIRRQSVNPPHSP